MRHNQASTKRVTTAEGGKFAAWEAQEMAPASSADRPVLIVAIPPRTGD